jgi:hypothetical protein
MRTKTLLIAAAALAVGIISSEAQVYSQNVVGYINITVPAGKFALIANQLDTGSNTIDNVISSGPVSSSTTASFWDPVAAHYNTFVYYNSDDSADGNQGWYTFANVPCTNALAPGQGIVVYNPSGSDITMTTVGQVIQGTNNYSVPTGFNLYSLPMPVGGTNAALDKAGFPAVSSDTTYYQWNVALTHYNEALVYYNSADSADGNSGWYTFGNVPEDNNAAVWPQAGQSFFVNNPDASTTWTNIFIVP